MFSSEITNKTRFDFADEFNDENIFYLNHKEIVQLLPLYKEESVYMYEATLKNQILYCKYNTFEYPFSKIQIQHFTRIHALLFVTQASYLIAIIFAEQNQYWPLNRERALYLAMHEQMTFTNIELNFKKFIKNQNGIELELSIPKFRIFNNRVFVEIEFNFPKGCFGKCKGIIALDKTLKIEG